MEKEDRHKDAQAKKKGDHITSHFDQTTIKLKSQSKTAQPLSEPLLRSIFSDFGTIDSISLSSAGHPSKAFVTFKYRDSALKALR